MSALICLSWSPWTRLRNVKCTRSKRTCKIRLTARKSKLRRASNQRWLSLNSSGNPPKLWVNHESPLSRAFRINIRISLKKLKSKRRSPMTNWSRLSISTRFWKTNLISIHPVWESKPRARRTCPSGFKPKFSRLGNGSPSEESTSSTSSAWTRTRSQTSLSALTNMNRNWLCKWRSSTVKEFRR